jgi:hypothetical protein
MGGTTKLEPEKDKAKARAKDKAKAGHDKAAGR